MGWFIDVLCQKGKERSIAYRFYENKASEAENTAEKLPLVASYVEKDFNDAWFCNEEGIRSDSEGVHNVVSAGTSPFKVEISEYITSLSMVAPAYADEVEKLRNIAKNNLSGVITTNYDLYSDIVTESMIKNTRSAIGNRTTWQIWTDENNNLLKAIRLLSCIPEEKVDIVQYQNILETIFTENINILSSLDSPDRSNLNRVIKIYDFLKIWAKKDPVIQAPASRHHHGGSDSWNTGNIASVNRHQHGCTINPYLLYEENYFLSTIRLGGKKGGGS